MMMDWVAPAFRGAAAQSFEAVRQVPRAAGSGRPDRGWREPAGHDILKQAGLDRLIGEGADVLAFVQKVEVARAIQPAFALASSASVNRSAA